MVHLSWPLRAHMSGGGCLPGGVAAGLLHLFGARGIPENRARLPLRPVLRSPLARRPIAFRLTFCPRGPCPFSRSPLPGFRPLLGSPPPPVSLRSHLCSQPGIISFAKTPRGLFGRAARRLLSRRNGDGKPSSPLPWQRVTFRHVAERSVAWFFFSLLGRRCAKGAHSENEQYARRGFPSDAGGERDCPKRGRPTQGDPK